jgi:hypothetical protein
MSNIRDPGFLFRSAWQRQVIFARFDVAFGG